MEYFLSNNFISVSQHGFLPTRSTCTNLIEVLNDWTLNMDERSDTLVAYIDFAKAFDSISITKLLLKLSHLGIGGNLLSCIHFFCPIVSRMLKLEINFQAIDKLRVGYPREVSLGLYCSQFLSTILPRVSRLNYPQRFMRMI